MVDVVMDVKSTTSGEFPVDIYFTAIIIEG